MWIFFLLIFYDICGLVRLQKRFSTLLKSGWARCWLEFFVTISMFLRAVFGCFKLVSIYNIYNITQDSLNFKYSLLSLNNHDFYDSKPNRFYVTETKVRVHFALNHFFIHYFLTLFAVDDVNGVKDTKIKFIYIAIKWSDFLINQKTKKIRRKKPQNVFKICQWFVA